MKEIILDGRELQSMEEIHKLFKEELALPEYYGFNLDALYDVLTERFEDIRLVIRNRQGFVLSLGKRYSRFMRMLEDAAEENGHIRLEIEQ